MDGECLCVCVCACACNRKLHKDEIHRQKEKALNNTVDTDSGSDMEIDSGFSVPGRMWNRLYRYVKVIAILLFGVMNCVMMLCGII